MDGPAKISPDVLARYAADAARDVEGVRSLVPDRMRRHNGVRVTDTDGGAVAIELNLSVDAGTSIPAVGGEVQRRVADYLQRMAATEPSRVDVVVREIG